MQNPLLQGVAVALLGALFLATSGAFGGGDAPYQLRLFYWTGLMLAGGLWGRLCYKTLGRFFELEDRPWLTIALLTLLVTVPLSVLVWAVTALLFANALPVLSSLPGFLFPVALVTAGALAITVFLGRAQPVQTSSGDPAAPRAPAFAKRVPLKLTGATILALQAEDHYLRIHTDRGSDLILMSLSQALRELDGLEGAQTHRSWWVSRAAVRAVDRGDGRATLTLANNVKVPVSRRYARTLRGDWW